MRSEEEVREKLRELMKFRDWLCEISQYDIAEGVERVISMLRWVLERK